MIINSDNRQNSDKGGKLQLIINLIIKEKEANRFLFLYY